MKKLFLLNTAVLLLFLTACQFDVPIQELASAKAAVSSAEKVKADKYAPDELKAAKDKIYKSHEFVRDEKKEDAIKAAEDAVKLASQAEEKALPLYTKDLLTETKKILSEADTAFAEVYSDDNYFEASEAVLAAEDLLNQKKNREAYNSAVEAKTKAEKALQDSLNKIPDLKKRMAEIKAETDSINNSGGDRFAADQIKEILGTLIKADEYLEDKNLRDATRQIAAAEKMLGDLKIKAEAFKEVVEVEDYIANTDKLLLKAENALAYEYASEKYLNALDLQDAAKKKLEEKDYKTAKESAEKASALALEAWNISIAKKPEIEKELSDKKAEYTELKNSGGDEYAPDEMKNASENIVEAEKSIAEDNLRAAKNYIDYAAASILSAKMKDIKYLSEMKIKKARESFDEINTDQNRKTHSPDLNKIDSMIGQAASLFEKNNYNDADKSADEALALIDKIKISLQQDSVVTETDNSDENLKQYTVKYNPKNRDCLWKIALREYKRADLWPLIYAANRDKIKDPDLIFPGQKFVIPPVPEKKKSENVKAENGSNESVNEDMFSNEESDDTIPGVIEEDSEKSKEDAESEEVSEKTEDTSVEGTIEESQDVNSSEESVEEVKDPDTEKSEETNEDLPEVDDGVIED